MKIVAFLQNPWSPVYAGKPWPRESWLRAFYLSPTGKKCSKFFGMHDVHWDNSSPITADNPKTIHQPDLDHMAGVIKTHNPKLIITFGKPAKEAAREMMGNNGIACSVLHLPHPTFRLVTNYLFEFASSVITEKRIKQGSVIELKQEREGKVSVIVDKGEFKNYRIKPKD
jgi:hypothetical protein